MSLLPIPGQVGGINVGAIGGSQSGAQQPGFLSNIGGLLTGSSPYAPLLNASLGLLAAGGPSTTPKNAMQRIAEGLMTGGQITQGQQKGLLANQLQRAKLQQYADQKERRANAQKAIPGLLEKLGPQTITSEEGDTVVPGLLSPQQVTALQSAAQLDPEGVAGLLAKGVTGQAFNTSAADPNVIRTLRAAGIDPQSAEGQKLIKQSVGGGDINSLMAQIQLTQSQLEIQRQQQVIDENRRKAAEAEAAGKSTRVALRSDIFNQINMAKEAAALLGDLQGTFAEPGFGGQTRGNVQAALAFAQDQFGADSSEAKALAAKVERLNSIATAFGLENFEAFTGALSDKETQIALGKDLALGKTVEANRLALADRMEIALSKADAENISIDGRDEIEATIQALRAAPQAASTPPPATPSAGKVDTSRFDGMSQADLLKLDETQMSPEEMLAWSAALSKSGPK